MSDAIPSLFEWIGGSRALERLTERFYVKVKADPMLAPIFAHMDARHPHFVAEFLGEVFGGPAAYTAERGGHAHMIGRHFTRHLNDAQRRRWIDLLVDTAGEVGVPDDPEFRSALMGYIEWGTRLAVINSQLDAHAVDPGPMPRWGWGEVKGPY